MSSSQKIQDNTVYIFKTICQFIKDLDEVYGKNYQSLHLYAALIERTGIVHEEPVKKHIICFHNYLKNNEEAILLNMLENVNNESIQYSEKVYIPMKEIIEKADKDEKTAIWRHLMTLLALLDPSSQAKKILKEEQDKKKQRGESFKEEKFLTDIIEKVGKHIDPTTDNPGDMMKNVMQSGVFNELIDTMNNGINDGDLDLGKMMSSLQMMMGNIGQILDNVKN